VAVDAAGHTPGTTALLVESNGERGMILGDIVHSVPELLRGWRFAVHTDPAEAVAAIERLRALLVADEIPCTAAHLTGMTWGRVRRESGKFHWEPINGGSMKEGR
jgi:glyoxylase-like metal-dependent hydrolase (beta-lactamase superfamily II)